MAVREYANPSEHRGAKPIGPEFNRELTRLCAKAGVERFTARSTRSGSACDMEAAGVPDALIDNSGRWEKGSRKPYSSKTMAGAHAIAACLKELRK